MLLTKDQWDIVCFIEQHHMRRGVFPTLRTISNATGINQVAVTEAMKEDLVRKALDNRGIQWAPVSSELLTGEQIATIQLLLDISDKRTIGEKLKSLGVSSSRYNGWKKNPVFLETYQESAEKLYGESLPEIHRSLIQEAVSGSLPHQKLALAISGRWDDKKREEQMNLRKLLIQVLEIIQMHVHEPDTLQAIAAEFEGIINPNAPKSLPMKAQTEEPS